MNGTLFRKWWIRVRHALGGKSMEANAEAEALALELRRFPREHIQQTRVQNEEILSRILHETKQAEKVDAETEALRKRIDAEVAATWAAASKAAAEAEKIRQEAELIRIQKWRELLAVKQELEEAGYAILISADQALTITKKQ